MDNSVVGRAVFWLARSIAILGGVVLSAVVIIVVASVVGRALIPFGLSAVPGDFEIVQFGVLFAIFCALPLTQYLRGHADVSVLVDHFPVRAVAVIEFIMGERPGASCERGLGARRREGRPAFVFRDCVVQPYLLALPESAMKSIKSPLLVAAAGCLMAQEEDKP